MDTVILKACLFFLNIFSVVLNRIPQTLSFNLQFILKYNFCACGYKDKDDLRFDYQQSSLERLNPMSDCDADNKRNYHMHCVVVCLFVLFLVMLAFMC